VYDDTPGNKTTDKPGLSILQILPEMQGAKRATGPEGTKTEGE